MFRSLFFVRSWMIAIAGLPLVIGEPLLAGTEVGNGGGAWVCRARNGKIRWAAVVDLFEAKEEFNLELEPQKGDASTIVRRIRERLRAASPEVAKSVEGFLQWTHGLKHVPPFVNHVTDKLSRVDDALFRLEPEAWRCPGGQIDYEQVVNFKNDGRILIRKEIFLGSRSDGVPHFSSFISSAETARAALIWHEAIYAWRRREAGDKSSVMTRRLVGLLFSSLSEAELRYSLYSLGLEKSPLGGREPPLSGPTDISSMSFVKVSPGALSVGPRQGHEDFWRGRKAYELRVHKEFEIQRTEVTQRQWVSVMGSNPSLVSSAEDCPSTFVAADKNSGVAMCPEHPVERVYWDDVQEFFRRLNVAKGRDGYTYRLPTGEEWEFAARAGRRTAYFWGDDPELGRLYVRENNGSVGNAIRVASLRPNPLGLYDILGNVGELVSGPKLAIQDESSQPVEVRGRIVHHDRDLRALGWSERWDDRGISSSIGFRVVRERRSGWRRD